MWWNTLDVSEVSFSTCIAGSPEIFGTKYIEILVLQKGTCTLVQNQDFTPFRPEDFWESTKKMTLQQRQFYPTRSGI